MVWNEVSFSKSKVKRDKVQIYISIYIWYKPSLPLQDKAIKTLEHLTMLKVICS